jgi:DNA-binding NarL/FixJ family response regulator
MRMYAQATYPRQPDLREVHAHLEEAFDGCLRALLDLVACAGDDDYAPRLDGAPLTPREHEVAQLISHGLSNPEVAHILIVSERTVDTHVQNLLRKLNLRSRSYVGAALRAQFSQPALRGDTPPRTSSSR